MTSILQNNFPLSVKLMITLQTLKLDKTKIKEIPEEMGKLSKLVKKKLFKNLKYSKNK